MRQKVNSMKRIKLGISLICLIVGTGLTGCSNLTSVYVLNQDEILMLKKGDTMTVPYDGTFYSQRAESRVMNAKIAKVKLK